MALASALASCEGDREREIVIKKGREAGGERSGDVRALISGELGRSDVGVPEQSELASGGHAVRLLCLVPVIRSRGGELRDRERHMRKRRKREEEEGRQCSSAAAARVAGDPRARWDMEELLSS